MKIRRALIVLCAFYLPVQVWSAIVGTNTPSLPVTAERIATLPAAEQPAWNEYLARSKKQLHADQDFLVQERKEHKLKAPLDPPAGRDAEDLSLKEAPAWYAQPKAMHIADIVISYQTPAGGWSKNINLTERVRGPGERFSHDGAPKGQAPTDYDLPPDRNWNYVGTFDNDSTTTELQFLAKVVTALNGHGDEKYRRAFMHGLDYIFESQYPNGGWPQVWPLEGGYHDGITYNDSAMINVLELLNDIARGAKDFTFVPQPVRQEATERLQRGLKCVVKTQVIANGTRTVWCQQNDALTLVPTSARNYEMPAQSSGESAKMVNFLMRLPNPDPDIVAAVHAARLGSEKTQILGYKFIRRTDDANQLVRAEDGWPLWSRYVEIGTDRPLFGDRDKTIHDTLTEISKERRNGYSWYGKGPTGTLQQYAIWAKKHPKT